MMNEAPEPAVNNMSTAPAERKPPPRAVKHGDYQRQRFLKERGRKAIDRRTGEGKLALDWQASVLKAKGGASCPHWLKVEIRLATFDLWRLLHLQSYLIADCNERQALINKRYRVLPSIHDQYNQIEFRFARRLESLDLAKGGAGLDLASRLAQAQKAQDGTR